MYILIGDIELEAITGDVVLDLRESFYDCAQLACSEQADLREHLRVRDRAADIVTIKPSIERQ
jgi:hypothetical protein